MYYSWELYLTANEQRKINHHHLIPSLQGRLCATDLQLALSFTFMVTWISWVPSILSVLPTHLYYHCYFFSFNFSLKYGSLYCVMPLDKTKIFWLVLTFSLYSPLSSLYQFESLNYLFHFPLYLLPMLLHHRGVCRTHTINN